MNQNPPASRSGSHEFYNAGKYSHLKFFAIAGLALGLFAASLSLLKADASEILGPDGYYYPDWRLAGVQGGIPHVTNVIATITTSQANSNLAGAIQTAVNNATTEGIIQLPAGTYSLTQPVYIGKNGIVISGSGTTNSNTIINFTMQPPVSGTATFFQPVSTITTLHKNTWVEAQVNPTGLTQIQLLAGPTINNLSVISTMTQGTDGGNIFCIDTYGQYVINACGSSTSGVVRCIATYGLNGTVSVDRTFTLSNTTDSTAFARPMYLGAFTFSAPGTWGTTYVNLQASASRGDTVLQMPSGHGFNVGDTVELHAPNTSVFNSETGNVCVEDQFRKYQFQIVATTATSVTLNQPLRIDYPIEVSSTPPMLYKIQTIQNCGLQNFTLNQTSNLWTAGASFNWGWNCWAEDVAVNQCGRFPIWFAPSKWCEIDNCTFNGSWYTGGGGSAYIGFEMAYDCLMQNVTGSGFRHGPLVQWSASGDVIRNSTFTDSDAQWHAGWSNNNLFENVTVSSNLSKPNATTQTYSNYGSYGDSAYSSAPNDSDHGPNGPYNVVYNSDFSSPLYAIFMGGSNDTWTFLWNRFVTDTGEAFQFQQSSNNHLIQNNIFQMEQSPFGMLLDATCSGSAIGDNQFSGSFNSLALYAGPGTVGTSIGNTTTDTLQTVSFPNGGFESGDFTGWTVTGDTGLSSVKSGSAYLGSYGLNVSNTTTSQVQPSVVSSAFVVSPGVTYASRFFYRVNQDLAGAAAYIEFFDSTGKLLQKSTLVLSDTKGSWMPDMVVLAAPSSAATVQIMIHCNAGNVANVDFDNFEFGAIGKLANSTIAFDSGFEAGPAWVGWNNSADAGHSTLISERNNTTNHVVETTPGSSLASSSFPVVAGDTYQARFIASTISGTNSPASVSLEFFDSGNHILLQQPFNVPNNLPASTLNPKLAWQQHMVRAVAPAGAVTGAVTISSASFGGATVDLDNFTVLHLPPRPVPSGQSVPSIYAWELNPVYPLTNSGFEMGNLTNWITTVNGGDNGMSSVTTGAAHSGSYGLQVVDTNGTTLGSSVASQPILGAAGLQFKLSFWAKIVSGSGIGVYLRFLDSSNNLISAPVIGIGNDTSWTQFSQTFTAPANTASVQIWIHSYGSSVVTADLDDFQLSQVIPQN